MEAEALRSAVEHAGLAAAGIGFLAGLAFGFNPVALASIPVSLAYVTKGRDKAEARLGLARGASVVCIRCRPSGPDCHRSIRRELAREPKKPFSLPARLRDRRRPDADRDGYLYVERRADFGPCIGDVNRRWCLPATGQTLLGTLHQACTSSLMPSVRMLHPALIAAKLGVANCLSKSASCAISRSPSGIASAFMARKSAICCSDSALMDRPSRPA